MRLRHSSFLLLVLLPLLAGCAQTYPIHRYNGELYLFTSFKYGDQHFLYHVEFYESGALKSETAEFDRKISPLMEQGVKFGESLIAGARDAF